MTTSMPLDALLADLLPARDVPPVLVSGLALDSREVRPGDLFIALRGSAGHGLQYVEQARKRGAVAVVAEFETPDQARAAKPALAFGDSTPNLDLPLILAPVVRPLIGAMAQRLYGRSALRVVGVTGTNGKTSTVQFIAQAADRLGLRAATQGTLGAGAVGALLAGERTTPDVCATHRFLAEVAAQHIGLTAMEVSSHALDQGRVDGVPFEVAVFTQLTRDHLDYHGTMEAYFEAKARLFGWPDLRAAVINIDCPYGRQLLPRLASSVRAITYSASGNAAHLSARSVRLDTRGIAFELQASDRGMPRADSGDIAHREGDATSVYAVQTRLLGKFNVDNLLAAAGTLLALGFDLADIVQALAELQPVPGRMNRIAAPNAPTVVVDYAHTPDAIRVAIDALRAHQPEALSIVFGCGGERDRGKRPLMAQAAAAANRLYITDDNPRNESGDAIVADIVSGLPTHATATIERDRARAIRRAIADAAANDMVLIAGKGHEPYQEIAGRKLPFDDAVVAREALAERAA